MKKKILSVLLATAMVAAFASGCGSDEGDGTPADVADTGDSSEADLVYWSMWTSGEPQAVAIQEIIDQYEEETGVTVQVEWKGRDIATLIQSALESGTKIDLYDDDYQRVSESYKDYNLDMTEMADAAGYAEKGSEILLEQVKNWSGGTLNCIPYQNYTSGIVYSKEAFEDAGITEEPQTWDEFLDVCQKLKDAGYDPLALDSAYTRYMYGYQLARYIGQDAVKELTNNGGWASSEAAKNAAEDMLELIDKEYFEPGAPGTYPESENTIGYGTSAMIVNASYVANEIANQTENTEMTWGMFNYPSVDGGADARTVANQGAQGFAIPSASENAQEAFDLIMKITTGEGDAALSEACNTIPADKTNTEWPALISDFTDDYSEVTNIYEWNMGLNANADVKDGLNTVITGLFEGQYADADAFLQAMDALY